MECKMCGTEITKETKCCKNCGNPVIAKKKGISTKFLIGIISLVLLLGIGIKLIVDKINVSVCPVTSEFVSTFPFNGTYADVKKWLEKNDYTWETDDGERGLGSIHTDGGWILDTMDFAGVGGRYGIYAVWRKVDIINCDEIYQNCRMELELLFGPATRVEDDYAQYKDGKVVISNEGTFVNIHMYL